MAQKVVVYGGRGALGSAVVAHFKKNGFKVVSIDVHPNEEADVSVAVDVNAGWTEQEAKILEGLSAADVGEVEGVFCVAGGWTGGSAKDDDMIKNADLMWKQSVYSSAIAARIAVKHLKAGGVLQLTGAAPALNAGTPGMMGYGMAKAAVHQLTKSLAAPEAGLPEGASALAILPITLDTPMNRKWMPKADHSTWTPLSFIAEKFFSWTTTPSSRPPSGSLLILKTAEGETKIEAH